MGYEGRELFDFLIFRIHLNLYNYFHNFIIKHKTKKIMSFLVHLLLVEQRWKLKNNIGNPFLFTLKTWNMETFPVVWIRTDFKIWKKKLTHSICFLVSSG